MISLCSLYDYNSVEDLLLDMCDVSRNKIKTKLSKKFRLSHVKKHQVIHVSIDLLNAGYINPEFKGLKKPIIIEETSDFLILSKPYGVHAHPHSYTDHNNVLSYLRSEHFFSPLNINVKNYDRGLLYRLDFETSGLMILLKDETLLKKYRSHFSEKVKSKIYYAIVKGKISKQGNIKTLIKYSGFKNKKAKIITGDDNEGIKLNLEILKINYHKDHDISLVKIKLKEGKRHQIRVQLMALGHPILGDKLYGEEHPLRMFLHCFEYQLEYEGKTLTFRDKNFYLFSHFFNPDTDF